MELHVPAHSTDDAYTSNVSHSEHAGMRAASRQNGQPLSDISNTSKIGMSLLIALHQPLYCADAVGHHAPVCPWAEHIKVLMHALTVCLLCVPIAAQCSYRPSCCLLKAGSHNIASSHGTHLCSMLR